MGTRRPLVWRCGSLGLDCSERTLVMGVLNVTPDSFSDGGELPDAITAVKRGVQMAHEGADILDVGGESTRPGSDEVPAPEEIRRTAPVIEVLSSETDVPISIDTRKTEVARAALAAGSTIVNDVSAGSDRDMFGVVRDAGAGMVLMHMQGEPKTMQDAPHYEDVVDEVKEFLRERLEAAMFAGVERDRLCVDPGIGFGKTLEHNLLLLHHVEAFLDLDVPVLVGPSRKRFLGAILDIDDAADRVEATAGAAAWLAAQGAHVVRVHDVKEIVRVVRVVDAILRAGEHA